MPSARTRAPPVPAKAKAALEILFNDPKTDYAAAAQTVGISTHKLREYLKLPQTRTYIYHEKRAFLDALSVSNPAALKEIRDRSGNDMARVAAIKTSEQMLQTVVEETRGGAQRHMPGLVVVIEGARGAVIQTIPPPAPLTIEHEPERIRELPPDR
jgi:hypothetical protein